MRAILLAFTFLSIASFASADGFIAVGQSNGDGTINIHDGLTGSFIKSFQALGSSYSGGVWVATGDVDALGYDNVIVGTGPTANPRVAVYDWRLNAFVHTFPTLGAAFQGGARVSSADLNFDGYDDVIVGSGPGTEGVVKVFSGLNYAELASFTPFPGATGGLFVAATELGPGGLPRIIVSSGNSVGVFTAAGVLQSTFLAYVGYSGGVRVAAGDMDGDGVAEIVTGPATGGAAVQVFDGKTFSPQLSFTAFSAPYPNGVAVAAGDTDKNLLCGTAGSGGTVAQFDGSTGGFASLFKPFGAQYSSGLDVGYGNRLIGNTLEIQPITPNSGVPMTVWTADLKGHKSGTTPMSRLYAPGQVVSVTAPEKVGERWFERWSTPDHGDMPIGLRTVTVTMDTSRTLWAKYLGRCVLTIDSNEPSLPVTVYKVDKNGLANGATPFDRTYSEGSVISLNFPAALGANRYYDHFEIGGISYGAPRPAGVSLGNATSSIVKVVYATGSFLHVLSSQAQVPITVWTRDCKGLTSGTAPFDRLYRPEYQAALTAPGSANGKAFLYWDLNGTPQTPGKMTVKVNMSTDSIATAVYED